ncbi:hypothetical protein [Flavobacterium sp.]|uniref:hypothetical protein n=1 Tax=Flavobacterium sp. TaxID=239 RepID=UPI002FDCCD66
MNLEEIKKEIQIIESHLTEKELNKDLIEVQNDELIKYLETIGAREIRYKTGNQPQLGKFTELGGVTNLWYKDDNDIWLIKNYEIKRFF